jgi:mannose-6-phosphate isomerase-like protein (cupin superfamily)
MVNKIDIPTDHCMIPVRKSPKDYAVYRISPRDSNRLAIIFDTATADESLTVCVEIFDPYGKTPPNRHNFAVEMFFILKGEGLGLKAGDSLLVRPTGIHEIRNIGANRLYALCFMVPNENFSELIRNGIPEELDEEDLQVLCHFS